MSDRAAREFSDLLDEVDDMLKMPDFIAHLAEKGVNSSLAMLAVEGLRAYTEGDRSKACEDLSAFVEEVRARRSLGNN